MLSIPREVLGRECASAFFGAIWAIDSDWAESAYRQLSLIGFEAAISLKQEKEAHTHAAPEGAPRPPPYTMVGNVAVVGIDGPLTKHDTSLSAFMGGTSTTRVRNAMRQAAVDPKVKAIMMRISSPGGHVSGTGDLADDIRSIRDVKPVIAFAEDVMASAAYWIGAQATHLVASPHAEVGSIGAYMRVVDDSAAAEKAGVKIHYVKSTPKKAAGTPPITDADLKEIQKRVDAGHALFVEGIVAGRGDKIDAEKVATGEVWSAKDAQALGLVDTVASIDDALAMAQKMAGEGDLRAAIDRKKLGPAAASASLGERPSAAIERASTQSDTLMKGGPPSTEQAASSEPSQEEEPDMTKNTDEAPVADPSGGAPSGSSSAPVVTPPAPKVEASPDIEELKVFMREQREKEAKQGKQALLEAHKRVAKAAPHMSAEQIAMLVTTPEAADALIESMRGARGSEDVTFSSPHAPDSGPIFSLVEAREKAQAAGYRSSNVKWRRGEA